MMFGIGTKSARLHVDAFVNMLGETDESWGLSHKGILWHGGHYRQYTKSFKENISTTIGKQIRIFVIRFINIIGMKVGIKSGMQDDLF